ncbi:MAG: hypothetical protein EBW90_11810, partial [Rhodobacteraceae bacterium]|nr:hypothetical protein [Paracoccaceae bacterium]
FKKINELEKHNIKPWIVELIKNNEVRVVNDYEEVVFPEGNPLAIKMIEETMGPVVAQLSEL